MYRRLFAMTVVGSALIATPGPVAHAQTSQQSAIACDNFARNYANNASRQGQVLGRGAVGSLAGLGLGAIAGASGVGAAVGATVGMIGGGAKRRGVAEQMYKAAYQDCMAGKIR